MDGLEMFRTDRSDEFCTLVPGLRSSAVSRRGHGEGSVHRTLAALRFMVRAMRA